MKWPSLSLGASELDTEKFSVDSVMKRISLDLEAKTSKPMAFSIKSLMKWTGLS